MLNLARPTVYMYIYIIQDLSKKGTNYYDSRPKGIFENSISQ